MVEGARLESVYTATYRGFESLPHRHLISKCPIKIDLFLTPRYPTCPPAVAGLSIISSQGRNRLASLFTGFAQSSGTRGIPIRPLGAAPNVSLRLEANLGLSF